MSNETDNNSHRQAVDNILAQIPELLTPDNNRMMEDVWEVHSRIHRLRKQEWLLEVDRWLREEAPEDTCIEVDYDSQDRRYWIKDDDGNMGEPFELLTDALDDIPIDDNFPQNACKRMNAIQWNRFEGRTVLGNLANSIGIKEGLAWLDSFSAIEQERLLDHQTPQVSKSKVKPGRL